MPVEKVKKGSQVKRKKQTQCKLTWIGEPVKVVFCFVLLSTTFPDMQDDAVKIISVYLSLMPFSLRGRSSTTTKSV